MSVIKTGLPILVEPIDLVNSVIISNDLTHMVKACVHCFPKIHYTSDLITLMKLQQETMSTCVRTPRKPKLYVTMADAS